MRLEWFQGALVDMDAREARGRDIYDGMGDQVYAYRDIETGRVFVLSLGADYAAFRPTDNSCPDDNDCTYPMSTPEECIEVATKAGQIVKRLDLG